MSGHTPGPWLKSGCIVLSNDEDRGMRFAIAERVRGRNAEDQEANARLIAASPTMYDYLVERAQSGDARAASIVEAINA